MFVILTIELTHCWPGIRFVVSKLFFLFSRIGGAKRFTRGIGCRVRLGIACFEEIFPFFQVSEWFVGVDHKSGCLPALYVTRRRANGKPPVIIYSRNQDPFGI